MQLNGQIERITFTADNGFTVARVRVEDTGEQITVVGTMASPMTGEVLAMEGEWTNHPRFGRQFSLTSYETAVPATVEGIERFLSSGLIKGVGPAMAKRIVSAFGGDTLDVIEHDINRLKTVEGIGAKRIDIIKGAWDDHREIRKVMLFLQSYGVGTGLAARVFKEYGNRTLQILQENPYRLAHELWGVGFKTADTIARKLGIPGDAPERIQAGVLYVLQECVSEGHVYCPRPVLLERVTDMLGLENSGMVGSALEREAENNTIVIENLDRYSGTDGYGAGVYLKAFHVSETGIAGRLKRLIAADGLFCDDLREGDMAASEGRLNITLARQQKAAVRAALTEKVVVITGGPGTGKTTIVNAICDLYREQQKSLLLAAPTGRAAKRMNEATGHPAKTIHRLLEFSFNSGGFQRNEENPLNCDLLVMDEASMIDTILMYHVLKAVPEHATLVLVGDVNQLPSVGAGTVLRDIIASGAVPVVELTEIYRQAQNSRIIVNAHAINQGHMPELAGATEQDDFFYIEKEDPDDVVQLIRDLVTTRIPRKYKYDPVNDIQVLTPMNRGPVGTENLNRVLQDVINPGNGGINRGIYTYRVNDKVMQIRNNYSKDVYNGDIGRIERIDEDEQEVTVTFDGRAITCDYTDLDELVLAYAVTVHKSQGSEYPVVVLPVMTQHYIMLQRNLLYTGVTRGKKLVVIIGTRRALAMAVKNDKTDERYTFLEYRLKG